MPLPPHIWWPGVALRRRGLLPIALLAAVLTTPGHVVEAGQGAPVPAGGRLSVATFYGAHFQGKRMANGQRYDRNDSTTAASNRWPLVPACGYDASPGGPVMPR